MVAILITSILAFLAIEYAMFSMNIQKNWITGKLEWRDGYCPFKELVVWTLVSAVCLFGMAILVPLVLKLI